MLDMELLELVQFKGQHYCTKSDAMDIKNFIFFLIFFAAKRPGGGGSRSHCTEDGATIDWSVI